ncbi:MAG: class I SAM-dependent methyltransferase [Peptostreptococcaceae bacterium]|nr:class I SAM-dependent methyltransferase [Peptostreptococcaceae bacterium]
MKSEQAWLELMKGEDGQLSERVLSDVCEQLFWKDFLSSERNTRKDEYSKAIEKKVLELLLPYRPESILEIGPGWGNYTFALAKECKQLTCLDISQDVLDLIRSRADRSGIDNIRLLHSKWEDAPEARYDAVFAYNCFYRICDIAESLRKIDRCAAKIAIIGMNSGIDRPCTLELQERLGLRVKKSRLDHRRMRDILLELGIRSETLEMEIFREYVFDDLEQATAYEKRFILDEKPPEDEVRKIVSKHYFYSEGKYRQSHTICAGLIFWGK